MGKKICATYLEVRRDTREIDIDDLPGKEAWFEEEGKKFVGHFVKKHGVVVIEWEDGTPDTIVDSETGRLVMTNCQVVLIS